MRASTVTLFAPCTESKTITRSGVSPAARAATSATCSEPGCESRTRALVAVSWYSSSSAV